MKSNENSEKRETARLKIDTQGRTVIRLDPAAEFIGAQVTEVGELLLWFLVDPDSKPEQWVFAATKNKSHVGIRAGEKKSHFVSTPGFRGRYMYHVWRVEKQAVIARKRQKAEVVA